MQDELIAGDKYLKTIEIYELSIIMLVILKSFIFALMCKIKKRLDNLVLTNNVAKCIESKDHSFNASIGG